MERDYPDWDLDERAEELLDRGIRDQIYRGIPPGTDTVAAEAEIGRDELTARLAGTTDKSTRAWKTARDTLTRYRSGRRTPGPKNAARIREAIEAARRDRIRAARHARVDISAGWITSRTRWYGKAVADLTGDDLTDFIAAIEQDDMVLAVQIVADAYGLDPDYVMGLDISDGVGVSIFSEGLPGNGDTP
jgi:hypothetical protein